MTVFVKVYKSVQNFDFGFFIATCMQLGWKCTDVEINLGANN
jgi:hypothetical protein